MADISGILANLLGLGSGAAAASPPGGILSAPTFDDEGNPIYQPGAAASIAPQLDPEGNPLPAAAGPQVDPEGNPIPPGAPLASSAVPTGGNGFWRTQNPDGTSSYLGGLITYDPKKDLSGGDRMGLFGATLADAGAGLSGHPADATNLQAFMKANKAAQAKQAVADAYASGDPTKIKAALVNYGLADGDSASGLSATMDSGKPKLQAFGVDQNILSTDANGKTTVLQVGQRKPLVNNGMISYDGGKNFTPIPGYVAQQSSIYNARDAAAAAHRAPKKAAAPGAMGNPASLFGGQ